MQEQQTIPQLKIKTTLWQQHKKTPHLSMWGQRTGLGFNPVLRET